MQSIPSHTICHVIPDVITVIVVATIINNVIVVHLDYVVTGLS